MRKRGVKYKQLEDNSKILGIGSLFRGVNRKHWSINLNFNGKLSKSLNFSAIPILARKRVLNSTTFYGQSGKAFGFTIMNAQQWAIAKSSDCPAYNKHIHGKDGGQFCFVADVGDTLLFIPQLEMARVLFFHDPFLARLSLQHNALSEDFYLAVSTSNRPTVFVREGADYPVSYFNRDDNRRFLSWVLLDKKARASFESIATFLIKNQMERNGHHHWDFQFTPPPLGEAKLRVKGWHDAESKSFFVWEIIQLNNLPSEISSEVDFVHPDYERKTGGKPTKGDGNKGQAPEQFELDDDKLPGTDKATIDLESERVIVTFKTPFLTNRISRKIKSVYNVIGEGDREVLDKNLSANEREEAGDVSGAAWNNLDDQTDDAHLYLSKFTSFLDMVALLESEHSCKIISKTTVKLPKIGRSKKHWLIDSCNPRCLAIVEIIYGNQAITILEVDTSDGAVKLSTMMLKIEIYGWAAQNLDSIMKGIIKNSLGWPTALFKESVTKNGYSGIPHPKSKHAGLLDKNEIAPWAQRFVNWIKR